MRLLLDTCTFLWIVGGEPELSPAARAAFADPANEVFLSAASCAEIAVKWALRRLKLAAEPALFVPAERKRHRIAELPIDQAAALALARLPKLHRDPFDRLLVCQAIQGGLTILTPDEEIRRYAVATAW